MIGSKLKAVLSIFNLWRWITTPPATDWMTGEPMDATDKKDQDNDQR